MNTVQNQSPGGQPSETQSTPDPWSLARTLDDLKTAMFHREHVETPTPKACTSNAMWWVVAAGVRRGCCGPHLYMMLGQHLADEPTYGEDEPTPGTPCEYLEVGRG